MAEDVSTVEVLQAGDESDIFFYNSVTVTSGISSSAASPSTLLSLTGQFLIKVTSLYVNNRSHVGGYYTLVPHPSACRLTIYVPPMQTIVMAKETQPIYAASNSLKHYISSTGSMSVAINYVAMKNP